MWRFDRASLPAPDQCDSYGKRFRIACIGRIGLPSHWRDFGLAEVAELDVRMMDVTHETKERVVGLCPSVLRCFNIE